MVNSILRVMLRYMPLTAHSFPQMKERRLIVKVLLQAAAQWVDRADCPQASAALDYLRLHSVLRLPRSQEEILYDADSISIDEALFICPVLPVDAWLLADDDVPTQFARRSSVDGLSGSYYRLTNSIFFGGGWSLSPRWQSLDLLHEAIHAWRFVTTLDTAEPDSYSEERLVRSLVSKVVSAFLTEDMSQKLRDIAKVDCKSNLATRRILTYIPSEAVLPESVITSWFGPAVSRDDSACRRHYLGQIVMSWYLDGSATIGPELQSRS
jgi:hypothetical protein